MEYPEHFSPGRDAKRRVAEGNGFDRPSDLPRFRPHTHTETDDPRVHRSWADCANTWCTWAASIYA